MFKLERPNMAVNDPRVAGVGKIRQFQMWNTWNIQQNESRQHIIEWVSSVAHSANGGKLKNLVLSCHGGPAQLQLGQGFTSANIPMFAAWRNIVEKIWLPNCSVAQVQPGANDGNVFCSSLARQINGYVVAATEIQCERVGLLPIDMMTSFEGLILCYGPNGDVTWSSRNPSTWDRGNGWMNRILGRAGSCVPVPD